jgi:hypothetical protein
MQNMLKYLMRLRLHVSVLVPLSDPRAKAKASERQGKEIRGCESPFITKYIKRHIRTTPPPFICHEGSTVTRPPWSVIVAVSTHHRRRVLCLRARFSFFFFLDKTFVLFWGAYHAVSLFRSPCKESWSPSAENSKKRKIAMAAGKKK